MRDNHRSSWKIALISAAVVAAASGVLVAADEPISDVTFDTIPGSTTFQPGSDPVTIDGDVVINGIVEARSIHTANGQVLVDPGVTENVALTFAERAVYIVKASWGGGGQEGTRAWFVLTSNDLNSITGQPDIVEIGMTDGTAHYSDTLVLEQSVAVGWSQLQLTCTRSVGSDSRYCRWAVTRLSDM